MDFLLSKVCDGGLVLVKDSAMEPDLMLSLTMGGEITCGDGDLLVFELEDSEELECEMGTGVVSFEDRSIIGWLTSWLVNQSLDLFSNTEYVLVLAYLEFFEAVAGFVSTP